MSIRETFSNITSLPVTNESDKGALIKQCLGTFTILLVEASSETGLFRHLSDYVFGVRNFEITKSMSIIFFVKMFKILARFQKCSKKLTKVLCFCHSWIWIGIVKLPLLRTGYLSSAANVLTSSPSMWPLKNREFFQLDQLGIVQSI